MEAGARSAVKIPLITTNHHLELENDLKLPQLTLKKWRKLDHWNLSCYNQYLCV